MQILQFTIIIAVASIAAFGLHGYYSMEVFNYLDCCSLNNEMITFTVNLQLYWQLNGNFHLTNDFWRIISEAAWSASAAKADAFASSRILKALEQLASHRSNPLSDLLNTNSPFAKVRFLSLDWK